MKGTPKKSPAAPGPMAGYVFQSRYALLKAVHRLSHDPTAAVAIETIDDVAVVKDGKVEELDQLKHTVNDDEPLTDYSKALWRTLGSWVRMCATGTLDPTTTDFFLVTNADVPAPSALQRLTEDDAARDVVGAHEVLRNVAKISTNKDTATDRADFLALTDPEQMALLSATTVVTDSPGVGGIAVELDIALKFACEHRQIAEFRQELEGWWLDEISKQLETGVGAVIQLTRLDAKICGLREKFKASVLHIDDDVEDEPGPVDLDGYTFIEQMKCVGSGVQRIANAQRVFMRARAQRSRWLRELKVDPEDLTRYDDDLHDRWQTTSATVWDDLTPSSDENARQDAGRELLAWSEKQETPLKGARALFLTGGSFHALADEVRLGWHPDFAQKFKK